MGVYPVKPLQFRAIQVQYAQEPFGAPQRYHHFGTGGGVAGDVTREQVHIGYYHGSPPLGRGPAHPRPRAMRTQAGLPWNGPNTNCSCLHR